MNSSEVSYNVSVKKAAGFSQYDTARLQVSVGGPNHEGAKLAAMIDWMKSRFSHVIICVNDTLQRHNLKFENGMPDDMAMRATLGRGDQWLVQNRAVLDTLPSYTIRRWEDMRAHPRYAAMLADITALDACQADMAAAIDSIIVEFWERRGKRLGVTEDFRLPLFQKYSRAYLLEEMAAFILMFGMEQAADIYPGSIRLPFSVVEHYLPDVGPVGFGEKIFTHLSLVRKTSDAQAV